jgi:thiol-disulfide isomerase/thioredoxin
MKFIQLLLITIIIFSCQSEPVDYAIISGKITNTDSDSLVISNNFEEKIKKIKIQSDGTFSDTLFKANGYYYFSDGKEHTAMYIENTSNIVIELDAKEFDKSIRYSGKGAEENNYLAQKYLLDESLGDPKKLIALEEKMFLAKINAYNDSLNKKLLAISNQKFIKLEKENLRYEYVLKVSPYKRSHKYISKDPNFKVSDTFPDLMEKVVFDDEIKFSNSTAYQQLTMKSVFLQAKKIEVKDSVLFQSAAINEIKKIKSNRIKNKLLSSLSFLINNSNANAEELYNDIMTLSTDEKFKENLTKSYNLLSKITIGEVSPKFNDYENYDGRTSSLDDFKGKYIYIDVWATWCTPCIAEIPALKELSKTYKDHDIVFISISIDKKRAHNTWKRMIEEKEMNGVQLFADDDWNSSFAREYGIESIPRFILIDKEGKILLPNAPPPSNPELIRYFKENKI